MMSEDQIHALIWDLQRRYQSLADSGHSGPLSTAQLLGAIKALRVALGEVKSWDE